MEEQTNENLQKELISQIEEIENKKYLLDLDLQNSRILEIFIREEAKWTFSEMLGIEKLSEEIDKSLDKNKKIFLPYVAYESINFYLSKVEGKGFKVESQVFDFESFKKAIRSVNSILFVCKKDLETISDLKFKLESLRQGINPENAEKVLETSE